MKLCLAMLMVVFCQVELFAQDYSASVDSYDPLEYDTEFAKDTTLNYLDTDSTWWSSLQLGLNFNQSSFSENWTGGGVNSFAFTSLFSYQLHYKNEDITWDNQFEGLYGIVKNADQVNIRKSQDRIYLDSKLGYRLSENWNLFFSSNFLTQFGPGYNYSEDSLGEEQRSLVSTFLAPGYFTNAIGLEYQPNEHFFLRISPLSPRLTFVKNQNLVTEDNKNYGVPEGQTVRKEWYAFQIVTEYKKDLTEIINLQARYMLFANYDEFSFDTIDHRLDLLFNAKLTRFINFSAGAIVLYDFDQDNQVQISQTMGIGILLQR